MCRRATPTPMLCATVLCDSSAIRPSAISHQPLNAKLLGVPGEAQLTRRSHVADERRRGDDDRAREEPFAAEAHAVLPVPVERGDRPLPFRQRVGTLAEARAAP